MAHRHSQRRNMAAPESNPAPCHHPDLIQPSFLVKHLSSLNLSHKTRAPHKHPPLVDTRLQAKPITTSAILDFSKPDNTKPAKGTYKDKPCLEVERQKLHGSIKNDHIIKDVKVEKSRNHRHGHGVVERVSVSLAPSGGRRRSFCGSRVDLGDVFAINGAKMVSADMPPFMQIHAVDCARKAFDSMEKFTSKTLALSLKKEFDGVYGPAWHCIVGTSFGSFVTHSVGGFLYFSMDQKLYILLFKTAVQKAG